MWSKSVELLNPYEAVKAAAPVTKWRKKHRRCEFCIMYGKYCPNCGAKMDLKEAPNAEMQP